MVTFNIKLVFVIMTKLSWFRNKVQKDATGCWLCSALWCNDASVLTEEKSQYVRLARVIDFLLMEQ